MIPSVGFLSAASDSSEEIQVLNDAIGEKKASLNEVNQKIQSLEKEVTRLQKQTSSLQNDVAIIENRTAKLELDLEATLLQRDTLLDEMRVLDVQIAELEEERVRQKEVLKTSLVQLQYAEDRSPLYLVFGHSTFSDFFEQIRFFERVNRRLDQAIKETRELQDHIKSRRATQEAKLSEVQALSEQMEDQHLQLSYQQNAKELLVEQTKASKAQYEALVADLVAEQAAIQNQIVKLQDDVDRRLKQEDEGGGGVSVMNWPLPASSSRITTLFHDPTYPFRHLFEHSGLDIATPVGSEVRSPAPGYVAWTRQGQLYGNYMMVVHADGLATLYAHLSSFTAKADQYVSRGDVIARSGGCRGCPGAGLSTGPHLHFEVRKNGIPVNPLQYVIRP